MNSGRCLLTGERWCDTVAVRIMVPLPEEWRDDAMHVDAPKWVSLPVCERAGRWYRLLTKFPTTKVDKEDLNPWVTNKLVRNPQTQDILTFDPRHRPRILGPQEGYVGRYLEDDYDR